MTVFPGTTHNAHATVIYQQMLVRRCDIDTSRAEEGAVLRMHSRQISGASQNIRQYAGALRRKMHHNKQCCRKILREATYKALQGFHSAYRTPDYDNIAVCQCCLPISFLLVSW